METLAVGSVFDLKTLDQQAPKPSDFGKKLDEAIKSKPDKTKTKTEKSEQGREAANAKQTTSTQNPDSDPESKKSQDAGSQPAAAQSAQVAVAAQAAVAAQSAVSAQQAAVTLKDAPPTIQASNAAPKAVAKPAEGPAKGQDSQEASLEAPTGLGKVSVQTAAKAVAASDKSAPAPKNSKVASFAEAVVKIDSEETDSKGKGGKNSGDGSSQSQVFVPNKAVVAQEVKAAAPEKLDTSTRDRVIDQVADRMQLLAATQHKAPVTIEMNPPELGQVTVTLRAEGQKFSAELSATHDGVREALSDSKMHLQQAMAHRGLQMQTIHVQQSSNSAQTQTNNHQRQSMEMGGEGKPNQGFGSNQRHSGTSGQPGRAAEASTADAWSWTSSEVVDYRI